MKHTGIRRIFFSPISALVVMSLIATLFRTAYVLARVPLSSHADSLAIICWAWPVLIWLDYDAARARRRPCFDFGLFLSATFPWSVVWYCFWSRGWRGIKLLLGLGALLVVPIFVASVLQEFSR